jgi:prepilin-type N-terminal cleavage/methylation domain-containing protein
MKGKKNGGYSLIEMIVSIAILGVVAAAAVGFMVSGANSFSSVSGSVNLQVRSQLTMNNIQEKLVDCNYGLDFNGDTLYIINEKTDEDGNPVYTADIYRYSGDTVYYGNTNCTLSAGVLTYRSTDLKLYLLAKGVASFSVLYPEGHTEGARLAGVTLEIEFRERNRSFLGRQTTALRNSPLDVQVTPIT